MLRVTSATFTERLLELIVNCVTFASVVLVTVKLFVVGTDATTYDPLKMLGLFPVMLDIVTVLPTSNP